MLGPVAGEFDLHEGLDGEAELHGVELGRVAADQAAGFQPLAAAARLAGREAELCTEILRGELRVLLEGREQADIGFIKHMRILCGLRDRFANLTQGAREIRP